MPQPSWPEFALAEAAVWERAGVDPMTLLATVEGRARLREIYGEYAAVGDVLLFAPTWRANRDRARCGDNQRALDFIRPFSPWTGALMGPRNDCYSPAEALSREEARDFHSWQAAELSQAEFILASTLPALSEALGIADVIEVPCVLSFVLTAEGHLFDGTPLDDAIRILDSEARHRPLGYWLNCVHPATACAGLQHVRSVHRIMGVQGNSSPVDPREFATCLDFRADSPEIFARGMRELRRRFGIRILGGCCGTRVEHLAAILAECPGGGG